MFNQKKLKGYIDKIDQKLYRTKYHNFLLKKKIN